MRALKLVILTLWVGIHAQAQQPANPTQLEIQRGAENPQSGK